MHASSTSQRGATRRLVLAVVLTAVAVACGLILGDLGASGDAVTTESVDAPPATSVAATDALPHAAAADAASSLVSEIAAAVRQDASEPHVISSAE